MRVSCRVCQADIFLNHEIGAYTYQGQCPICQAKYSVSQTKNDIEPQVVFETQGTVRSECMMCGKVFDRPQTQPLPVCNDCGDPQSPPTRTAAPRASTGLELGSQSLGPLPRIDLDIPLPRRPIPPAESTYPTKTEISWATRLGRVPWIQISVTTLVLLSLGWFSYRLLTFSVSAQSHPTIRKLVSQFETDLLSDIPGLPADERLAKARSVLQNDQHHQFPMAISLMKHAIIEAYQQDDPTLAEQLADLCLLYAAMGSYGDSPHDGLIDLAHTLSTLPSPSPRAVSCYIRALTLSRNGLDALQALESPLLQKDTFLFNLTRGYVHTLADLTEVDLSLALESLQTALKENSAGLETYALLATVLERLGRVNEAKDSLQTRLSLSPSDPYTMYRLGQLYFKAQDYRAARQWMEEALRISPEYSLARTLLAEIQIFVDAQYALAEKNLNRTLERYPVFLSPGYAHRNKALLSQVYFRMGRFTESSRLAQTLPLLVNLPEVARLKMAALENTPAFESALTDLQATVIEHPLDYLSNLALGRAYLSKRNYLKATQAFGQALALPHPDILSGLYLVAALYQGNDMGRALDQSYKLLSTKGLWIGEPRHSELSSQPSNKELLALRDQLLAMVKRQKTNSAVYPSLAGLMHLYLGIHTGWASEFKEALVWFERAGKVISTLDYVWFYQGLSHYFLKNSIAARTKFDRCLALNPNQLAARYWLAKIYIDEKLYPRAHVHLEPLLKSPEWEARAHILMGLIAQREGKSELATGAFQKAISLDPDLVTPHRYLILSQGGL